LTATTSRTGNGERLRKAGSLLLRALRVLVVLCALPAAARADAYPGHADLYVNDYAGVIAPDAETGLRAELQRLREDTGVEMTVLTIPARRDYDALVSVETFATGLFNAWSIGRRDCNDGIRVLVVPDDREMRLELGSGCEEGYDAVARDIADLDFLPRFRKGQYSEGVEAGVAETIRRIARRSRLSACAGAYETEYQGAKLGRSECVMSPSLS
jgi:uncharacterized protein